jgi:CheY-like chemotaxis protein
LQFDELAQMMGVSNHTVMKRTQVAIFEDDTVNRYIYERMFRDREDISLSVFDQTEAGIQKLKHTAFDVVFIEAHFRQNFGGIEILERLRSALPEPPICIAITSLLQKGDLERLMGAGFMMCLEKPIVFSDVIAIKR